MRQYDEHGSYATSSVKQRFGSWTNACTQAEVPHGYRHGNTCRGPHGELLQSHHEHAFATALFEYNLEYEPHPRVPDTRWRADFRLIESDLWIEVDGYSKGTRPNQEGFKQKLAHYERERIDYAVVQAIDDFERELGKRGIISE